MSLIYLLECDFKEIFLFCLIYQKDVNVYYSLSLIIIFRKFSFHIEKSSFLVSADNYSFIQDMKNAPVSTSDRFLKK